MTIKTRDVATAMSLLSAFAKGDNVIASANSAALTLVPITELATEKTITFSNAYLQPGLSMSPGENDEPSEVSLVFECKSDVSTGIPFTYAV